MAILLPEPFECWDYRRVLPCPPNSLILFFSITSLLYRFEPELYLKSRFLLKVLTLSRWLAWRCRQQHCLTLVLLITEIWIMSSSAKMPNIKVQYVYRRSIGGNVYCCCFKFEYFLRLSSFGFWFYFSRLSAVHYGLSLGKNDRLTIFLINSVSWYHSKIIFT